MNGAVEIAYDVRGTPLLLIAATSAERGLWSYVRLRLAERLRAIAFNNRYAGQGTIAT